MKMASKPCLEKKKLKSPTMREIERLLLKGVTIGAISKMFPHEDIARLNKIAEHHANTIFKSPTPIKIKHPKITNEIGFI